VILAAGGIFVLRVVGNMLTTVRLITIMRGQKFISSVIGFFEALIFAVALAGVVTNLSDPWNLTAYCLGYAVGGYLGMVLEQRLVQRFVSIQIISPQLAHEVALAIREAGYGATESQGMGAAGLVGTVTTVVGHRDVDRVIRLAHQIDPNAFVTMEELRGIARGHFRRLARPER